MSKSTPLLVAEATTIQRDTKLGLSLEIQAPAAGPPDLRALVVHLATRLMEIEWRAALLSGRAQLSARDQSTLDNISTIADTKTVPDLLAWMDRNGGRR